MLALAFAMAGCAVDEPLHAASTDGCETTGKPPTPSSCACLIVTGSIGDASVLLPVLASDAPSLDIARLIFNGLVKYDKDTHLAGDLAEQWQVYDGGKRIRFHLRKGVTWHDGKPFDSRDVEYTFKVYVNPKTPTPWASDFLKIKELRLLDDHTLDACYEEPFAPALESWDQGILPRHLLEGQDITKSPLQREPVGTGPYRFKTWAGGERISLSANADYFDGSPGVCQVLVRVIPDPATMFLLLKSGEVDRMDLTPMQYQRQTDNEWFATNFRKYRYLHFGYTYLGYNLQDWKFKDRRVRQALTHAINRERIVKTVLLGLGQVAHTPYKPDTPWYHSGVETYPYDPEKARALLAECGWADTDDDGVLDKDGQPFDFTIVTNQGNEMRKNAATLIQRDLKRVGISVRIRVLEWAALIKNFIHKRKFEACLLGWRIPVDPNQSDIWHSDKIVEPGLNFVTYVNPEVDKLLEQGTSVFGFDERKICYDRLQEILAKDQPYTFLWVQEDLPIIHSRFQGIEPAAMGIDHNFVQWRVPVSLRKYHILP
jgi:peptide/nickel transport system substrate-binding protein